MSVSTAQQKDERFDVETHFDFGQNWADFAEHINDRKVALADEGFYKLIPQDYLKGKTILDIGCGSGLHALSALRGGAAYVTGIDIDPVAVKTAKKVIEKIWSGKNYSYVAHNILSPKAHPDLQDSYDIVYSWGVLHHTGDLWAAVEKAASMVKPGGVFVLALYKKSPMCNAWKVEKKFYTGLPSWARTVFDYFYAGAYLLGKLAQGENPLEYIKGYEQERGMRFMNDVRDWLGGYPYESASPADVREKVEAFGFQTEVVYNAAPPRLRGLFGCGCAEYVFTRYE
jgi:2-polyprenyl-6-hydroxyphenyl methylase/3-demethylubiquinone-9 3-methyltransferase